MDIVIVSIAEAQKELPELLARVMAGDHVVIAQDGKAVAMLGKPPMLSTRSEEIEATVAARLDFIRTVVESHDHDGIPLPADHPLRALIAKRSAG